MINDLDIVQWEYLLSPEFELINSAGKPLTGGWIEVYLHGTRDKYYCASDFDGTLHPFKIPLDSIGANVVLADPNNAYDVYVYNKFGSLIMSRYNVKCQGSGGSSTYVGDKLYYGQYRASNVTTIANLRRNKGNINITDDGYLKLKSGMSYHITVRGSFTVDDPANEDTTLNYIEYTSVNPIKIDIDETKEGPQYFELSYDIYRLQEDMDYQVAFAQSNGMVTDLIVEVHSLSNLATSATGGDQEYEAGWGIDITNNVVSVDPSILEDYEYTAGDYISIDDNNVISVTGINPGDYATHDEVNNVSGQIIETVNNVSGDIIETVNNVSGVLHEEITNNNETVIETINNVSGILHEEIIETAQVITGLIPDVSDFTTHEEVYESSVTAIQLVTGLIPTDYTTHEEVNEAIVTAIELVTGLIPEAQVQSDWNETDTEDPAYIQNKPDLDIYATHDELNMVSGILHEEINNIDLSDYSTHTEVYNATVTAVQVATGAIPEMPEEEEVDFEEIELNDYALASAIPDISNLASHTEVYEATVTAIETVTGMIPEAQVQSDWDEDDSSNPAYIQNKPTIPSIEGLATVEQVSAVSGYLQNEIDNIPGQVQSDWTQDDNTQVDYIKNKPDEYDLVAGDNIAINVSGSDIVISSTGGGSTYTAGDNIEIDNDVISVKDVIMIHARPDSSSGLSAFGNITHWGEQDYGPGWYIKAHTDNDKDYVAYNTSDIGQEEFFWGDYATNRETNGVSAVSCLSIHEGDITYKAGEFQSTSTLPIIWSCNKMAQDITNLQSAITAIPSTVYTAGTGIDITNNTISVDNTVAMKTDIPVVTGFATKTELATVEAEIPTLPADEEVVFEELDLSDYALASAIPVVSGFATKTELSEVEAEIPTVQLNSSDEVISINNYPIHSEGGGTTYTAGTGIDITNDVISVSGVAMASALPTTELGKFTIQSNVSGGPIEVICPTDVAPVSAFYDLNAQYDDTLSNRTGPSTYYYVFKSPGYDNDTWSAISGDVIQLKVKETIQGIGTIIGFYASNSSPASSNAPTINYPASTPLVQGTGAAFTVEAGMYTTALGINPAGSSYGKYICLVVNVGGSGIYVDDILNKIEFTIGRPNAALGTTVNLNRYYLANSVNTSTPSSELACQVTVDSISKQQKVYLPGYMPSNWKGDIAQAFQYGTNGNSPNDYNYNIKQYRAYKYTSSPRRYQFAYCTDWDDANKLMTFIAYDNSGNAIEKWTLDYTTYGSNIWTTTPISSGGSTYTAGEHISIDNDEIAVTGITELVAGNAITITTSGASAIISSTGEAQVQADWDETDTDSKAYIQNKPTIPDYTGASGILINNDTISLDNPIGLVAGNNITIEVSGVSAIISSTGGGGGSSYTAGAGIDITNNEISVDNTVALKTDLPVISLNGSDQVTAIDGHALATGGSSGNNYIKVITDSAQTSEVTFGDLRALCEGHEEFDLYYDATLANRRYIYRCSRAKHNGSHYEVCFTTVPVSEVDEQDSSCYGKYSNTALDIYFWFWNIDSGGPSDDTIAYVRSNNFARRSIQVDWNETDTSAQTYIKNKPNLSQYVTQTELQTVSAAIPDTTDMATQTWVGSQGYLTSVPSNYVTDSELNGAVSGLATTNEVTIGLGTKQNTLTGITDVQVVNSLPVSPVSSVLYLIPEA